MLSEELTLNCDTEEQSERLLLTGQLHFDSDHARTSTELAAEQAVPYTVACRVQLYLCSWLAVTRQRLTAGREC